MKLESFGGVNGATRSKAMALMEPAASLRTRPDREDERENASIKITNTKKCGSELVNLTLG